MKPTTRMALLNIDMQYFFVEGIPEGHAVMKRINRLTALCHSVDIPVIHTTHVFRPNVPNTEEAVALHKGLTVHENDIIFAKHHFGALFHESNLEEILRNRGIDTLIISGIRTNVCCEVTAWEALSHEFSVYFLRLVSTWNKCSSKLIMINRVKRVKLRNIILPIS